MTSDHGPWRRLQSALRRWAPGLGGRTGELAWALSDQGTALVASILTFLLLGRALGPSGYGAYVGLYALIAPLVALSQSGVYLAIMEHIAREGEDPVDVARSFLSVLAANALIAVPVLSAVGLRWIEGLPALAAVLLVGAEFCLGSVLSMSVGMAQAMIGFAAAARLRMMGAFSKIVLVAALAAAGALTLTSLAIGQVATLGAVAAYALARTSRLIGVAPRPGRIRRGHVRSALLYGIQIGASVAQGDGDKFVLNAAHHQADAGRYGAAYRLMHVMLLPVSALLGMTHVSFLREAEDPKAQLRRAIRLSLVTMAYAVPAAVVLVVAAPLVPRILSRDFGETTLILQLLSPVVILRGLGGFPMNGLLGLRRNALRTRLLVGNALLSLALYAALIPSYSWRGALWGTLISEFSLNASGWVALVLCQRPRRTSPGPTPLADASGRRRA